MAPLTHIFHFFPSKIRTLIGNKRPLAAEWRCRRETWCFYQLAGQASVLGSPDFIFLQKYTLTQIFPCSCTGDVNSLVKAKKHTCWGVGNSFKTCHVLWLLQIQANPQDHHSFVTWWKGRNKYKLNNRWKKQPLHNCHSKKNNSVLQRRRNARVSLWVLVAQQFDGSAWLATLAAQSSASAASKAPAHPEKELHTESSPGLLCLTAGFVLAGSTALHCLLRLLQCLNPHHTSSPCSDRVSPSMNLG